MPLNSFTFGISATSLSFACAPGVVRSVDVREIPLVLVGHFAPIPFLRRDDQRAGADGPDSPDSKDERHPMRAAEHDGSFENGSSIAGGARIRGKRLRRGHGRVRASGAYGGDQRCDRRRGAGCAGSLASFAPVEQPRFAALLDHLHDDVAALQDRIDLVARQMAADRVLDRCLVELLQAGKDLTIAARDVAGRLQLGLACGRRGCGRSAQIVQSLPIMRFPRFRSTLAMS